MSIKIALLQPPPREIKQTHDVNAYPSLGLGYLASFLEKAGITDILIIDGRMENISSEQAVQDIADFSPDILGITAKTHEISHAAEIACEIKKCLPQSIIIIGGCHVTAEPESTLELFTSFDFAVTGEGENALLAICRAVEKGESFSGVPGLVHRNNNTIIHNPPAPFIEDLDKLPFPGWHLFRKKRRSYMIFGSRGCPYNCLFCMRVLGKNPRLRSAENIIAEIDWLVNEFNIVAFDFEDETFGLKKDLAFKICDMLIKRGYHKKLFWTANLRANLTDEELLIKMKQAGCVRVAIGVESGNPEVLKSVGKGITIAQIEEAFRLTRKVGIESVALMIIGHPNENKKTAMDTIRLATRLRSTSISIGIMVPYPGTEIRKMALNGEGGYKLLSKDWSDYDKYLGNALELDNLNRKQLERLQIWGYLRFYLFNFRILSLFSFVKSHSKEALLLLQKLIFSK
ncbi:MAG: B12-binding domain-containing radical SAM protein [Planctomycetota bacterium]|jgi:radical SAM superfamily enzyme YgiQ (UPF0313 family)